MKKLSKNETNIVGLINGIQQQLTSLERKVDALLGQSLQKPAEIKPLSKPFQQPFPHPVSIQTQNGNRQDSRFQAGNRQDNRHGERLMHKAICADCKKQCEVPFRPSEGRPVYCQDCFSRRKSSGSFNTSINSRPKQVVPAQTTKIDKPQAKPQVGDKKKPAGKKKVVAKKSKKK